MANQESSCTEKHPHISEYTAWTNVMQNNLLSPLVIGLVFEKIVPEGDYAVKNNNLSEYEQQVMHPFFLTNLCKIHLWLPLHKRKLILIPGKLDVHFFKRLIAKSTPINKTEELYHCLILVKNDHDC